MERPYIRIPMTDTNRLATALAGRYRIERELGAGGMATVYLAQDLRHDRRVAIKVLRPELGAVIGAERFLAEIKTTANLQHPHILGLLDSGDAEGLLYYVMPYVEGETVRDRIQREKQLPVTDAVRIATEVASALDYAHRHGVIHRDIKPENILLHDGSALVADFGIALAASKAGGTRMTETGMSLGTPHYMSPEQAMGEREITARSDVYALGAVLYEMLTGDPPFTGSTAQAIVARVVTEHPRSLTSQRHTIPPQVEAAVLTALEKLPADRFASAAEFAAALADTRFTPRGTAVITAARAGGRAPSRRAQAGWAVAVVAVGAALWGWLRPLPAPPQLRYGLALPPDQQLTNPRGTRLAISPDGSRFVYTGPGPEGVQLWLRNRSELSATPIPGTAGSITPAFSPDGQQIVFGTINTSAIRTATLTGAPPVTIADSSLGADGVTWSSDGYIYYDGLTGGGTTGLMRVRSSGGPVEQITTVDTAAGQIDHFWPQALPDGRGILFTIPHRNVRDASEVAVWDAKTKTVHTLVQGLTARYATPGYLLYVAAGGDLMAVPFDLGKLQVTGEAFAISNRVAGRPFGAVDLTLSSNGTLMYDRGDQLAAPNQMVFVSKAGTAQPVDSGWLGNFVSVAPSPDGKRLALSQIDGNEQQIWIKELPRGPLTKLSFDGNVNTRPAWTPDGASVAYIGNAQGPNRAFVVRKDGSGQASQLPLPRDRPIDLVQYTPDAKSLVYRTTPRDIFTIRLGVDTVGTPLVATGFEEMEFVLSPDGRWLAYSSDESGRFEVYVRPYPDAQSARWQISNEGGAEPHWAHSGRELFFVDRSGNLEGVSVLPGTTFVTGARRQYFNTVDYAGGVNAWAVMPGDSQFVMIGGGGFGAVPNELVVIENIFPELEARRVR